MAEHKYEFDIKMTCGGCSGAVERVLKKLDGVKSFQVDLPSQHAEVLVDGEQPSYEDVYQKIYKTGKTINSAKVDGQPRDLPAPPA